jgi:RIO kinase 1
VQRLGKEILSEYLGDDEFAAPRLVHARLATGQAEDLFAQAVTNVRLCATQGVVHGDLSPYNMLVWADRLVLIDFPQAVDPIANPDGLRLLERDVANLCQWAQRHGVVCDAGQVFAEVIGDLLRLWRRKPAHSASNLMWSAEGVRPELLCSSFDTSATWRRYRRGEGCP